MIQTLTNNDIPAADIIQMSGHKNLQSVTNYSVVSEKQQVKMSRTLSELMSGNVHSLEKTNSSQVAEFSTEIQGRTSPKSDVAFHGRCYLWRSIQHFYSVTASTNPRTVANPRS